ncbi:MAG: hypothetical protein JWM37_212 [Candidatus Saccharibacteria bacterium]|nr:hypothetical protein [Candidatus Saccharibacteria bacterium]
MIKKVKNFIVAATMALALGAPAVLVAAPTYAVSNGITSGLCSGATTASEGTVNGATSTVSSGTGCANAQTDGTGQIARIARTAINILSIIVGIVAVIMIIIGGFRYITSGGDSGKVGSAKNTIIYAIIGLILVALAQVIVNIVLSQVSQVS